jgi:type I protein arginine methyltransferase
MGAITERVLVFGVRAWRSINSRLRNTATVQRILYRFENEAEFCRVRSHEAMLADKRRVDLYKGMIDQFVRPEHVVLDLGTGTGILAFLAARKGARMVHAIEQSHMIDLAAHVALKNDIRNITFHHAHSRTLDLPEKVDIIVHEQIGDFLVDEDMIANVAELRDRILAPGGKILPARFEAYLEPVSLVDHRRIPLIWEQSVHGIDFGCTEEWLADRPEFETLSMRYVFAEDVSALLSEPEPAYSIDLETVRPDHVPGRLKMKKTIERDGIMEGFCQYFRIYFDDSTYLETGPLAPHESLSRYHWGIPLYPTGQIPLRKGDVLTIEWPIEKVTKPKQWKPVWSLSRSG